MSEFFETWIEPLEGETNLRFVLWQASCLRTDVHIFPLKRGKILSQITLQNPLTSAGAWYVINVRRTEWFAAVEAICDAAGVSPCTAGIALCRGLEAATERLNNRGGVSEEEEEEAVSA
jgi:hypothetical protein